VLVALLIVGLLLAAGIVTLLGAWSLHRSSWDDFNFGGTDD
jgi:membrane-associated PAP2 superfamily phosphatase